MQACSPPSQVMVCGRSVSQSVHFRAVSRFLEWGSVTALRPECKAVCDNVPENVDGHRDLILAFTAATRGVMIVFVENDSNNGTRIFTPTCGWGFQLWDSLVSGRLGHFLQAILSVSCSSIG